MTFDEFLANIKNKFKQYDSVGLIDEMSVYEDALYAIKSLGLLVLEKNSTVVQIKNGKGKLPSGFSKLVSAIKCTPYEYECEDEPERILQSSYMSAVKDIKRTEWNGCNPCDETYSEEIIVENKIDINKEYGKNLRLKSFASFCISAVETNCRYVFLPSLSFISLSSIIKELLSLSKLTFILSLICIAFLLFFSFINAFISLLLE